MAAADRIYARALFEAAEDRGRLDAVRQELDDLAASIAEVDELRQLLENPEADSRVKGDILVRLTEGGDDLVRNFVRLVAEKGRAAEISTIVAEFDRLVAAEERILDVELTTALELTDEDFG